jgi:hypothetical protein
MQKNMQLKATLE